MDYVNICVCNGKGEGTGNQGDCSVVTIALSLVGRRLLQVLHQKNK